MLEQKKIAIITEKDSDILKVLRRNNIDMVVFEPGQIHCNNLDEFHSIAILGGVSETPVLLHPRERLLIEEQLKKGKKIFAEYCASIGHIYCEPPVRTRFERLTFCSTKVTIEGINVGDLLDDQCGIRIKPYPGFCSHNTPILQYVFDIGHSKIQDMQYMENTGYAGTAENKENSQDIQNMKNISERALWFNQENLLISAFCLANYNRARFAPKLKFKRVVQFILKWLTDSDIDMDVLEEYYYTNMDSIHYNNTNTDSIQGLASDIGNSVIRAMDWFDRGGIVLNDGKDGVLEGLGTEIYPDGEQRICNIIRNDCVGEVSLAYFMYSLLMNNGKNDMDKSNIYNNDKHHNYYRTVSDNLASINFDMLQCKEQNEFHGMMRWSQEAWGVCYQDDAARAVIPQMLKCFYSRGMENMHDVKNTVIRNDKYLSECTYALDFLVKTTGTDGTRPPRTDNIHLDPEKIRKLAGEPANCPSAHYNAYYLAALLLGYKLTGKEKFKAVAVKGMETIMASYPDTIREHSQTQEYCRLILPLSWLYWVTGEVKHRDWLYMVTNDLQEFKHESGAYLEWDEGYKASMRNNAGKYENSLLASNGDPVVDLLYSNNWLPIGFIQAYFATKDIYFKKLWEETARFMAAAQIQSRDEKINGAWARGFDVEFMEVFGSPADVGWGPWAIESGWTVAEITSGLIMGLMEDKLIKFY